MAVRLAKNPEHYKLEADSPMYNLEDRIERICKRDLQLLREHDLISRDNNNSKIKCTEFGDAMARYYAKFETMKLILNLESRSKMSEIVYLASFPLVNA